MGDEKALAWRVVFHTSTILAWHGAQDSEPAYPDSWVTGPAWDAAAAGLDRPIAAPTARLKPKTRAKANQIQRFRFDLRMLIAVISK
jgi:hypothetical protein